MHPSALRGLIPLPFRESRTPPPQNSGAPGLSPTFYTKARDPHWLVCLVDPPTSPISPSHCPRCFLSSPRLQLLSLPGPPKQPEILAPKKDASSSSTANSTPHTLPSPGWMTLSKPLQAQKSTRPHLEQGSAQRCRGNEHPRPGGGRFWLSPPLTAGQPRLGHVGSRAAGAGGTEGLEEGHRLLRLGPERPASLPLTSGRPHRRVAPPGLPGSRGAPMCRVSSTHGLSTASPAR